MIRLPLLIVVASVASWQADVAIAHGDEAEQTECPVMIGNKIDPDLHTVYQGKKVYFCCASCKEAFESDPEKYMHRLPQFACSAGVTVAGDNSHGHESVTRWLARLIVPTGITTLSLLAVTVLLGVLRRAAHLKTRVVMRVHKTIGVIALVVGLAHAGLVMFLH